MAKIKKSARKDWIVKTIVKRSVKTFECQYKHEKMEIVSVSGNFMQTKSLFYGI